MLRIGSGAGFVGDRFEPAKILIERANLDYLILEGLAERTIALAQKQKRKDPNLGYNEYLEERIRSLLASLIKNKVRLITNMGAANPLSAAKKMMQIAGEMGIKCKVAAVTGDDVTHLIKEDSRVLENGKKLHEYQPIISANAYLGIEALLPALASDANIIVTGRVSDPSLFLAPIVHYYKWDTKNYDLLGRGTLVGHLLECAGQITGGYFADPGRKDVDKLAHLGFPYAIVQPDGTAVITKPSETGGTVNLQTVKEQLLYEVHDPENYVTPDCIANFYNATLREIGQDQVLVKGATGKERPDTLKVSVGYHAGYLGEGEISYAGSTALQRGRLAENIISERLKGKYHKFRTDLIGVSSLHHAQIGDHVPYEVRLRAAALCKTQKEAERVGHEVEALYTNGPAGGGGARKRTEEVIGVVSVLIDRSLPEMKTAVLG